MNPHAQVGIAARRVRATGHYRAPLTVQEQVAMASTLSAQFFHMARVSEAHLQSVTGGPLAGSPAGAHAGGGPGSYRRAAEVKHWATAWAIVTDKLALLQGRPTQILGLAEAERARPAVLALARKLFEVPAASTSHEQTPPGATSA